MLKKFFESKKQFGPIYTVMFGLFVATILIAKLTLLTPWSIVLVFFGLLLVPGFSLARIIKINFIDDRLGNFVLWLTLGLIFGLCLSGLAMIVGLNILVLNTVYPIVIGCLLVVAIVLDCLRKGDGSDFAYHCSWKNIFKTENLNYLILILFGLGGILAIAIQGSLFKGGDPSFHLSIVRKAFDGYALSATNLSFIKSDSIHIAYGLPVWHIFLALLAKFQRTDIFILWKDIVIPLSIFSILIWSWLSHKILANRYLASLSLIFFLLYIFNLNGGYLFTCLPLPDTLNSLIFLPLAVVLAVKYIYDPKTNFKLLIVTAVLVILMAMIHITQYFYFLMMLGMLAVVCLFFCWKNQEFKLILKRIGWVFLASFLIFLPLVALLEVKSHIISDALKTALETDQTTALRYRNFKKWNSFAKYAYILTPLMLLFIKKRPTIAFLFASMLIVPIAYIKPVSEWLMKVFDYILVNRLIGSITWHYIVLGLICGFLVLLVDRLVTKLSISRIWNYIINSLFVIGTAVFIWAEVKFKIGTMLYDKIFSDLTDEWLIKNHVFIVYALIAVTLVLLLISYFRPRLMDFFELNEPRNGVVTASFTLCLLVIFFSVTYTDNWKFIDFSLHRNFYLEKTTHQDLRSEENYVENTISGLGKQSMIDFVRSNVPSKSVFMVPGNTVYTFPILVDQFIVSYPRTSKLTKASRIYDDNYDITEKLKIIDSTKMQYILMYRPEKQGEAFLDKYPQYFQKIFKDSAVIYKVLPH